jgi:hypothetical protein
MRWLALVALLFAAPVEAATYYINCSSGSDSNDGSIGSPWATLTKARDTMSAGDTTYIRGGTCTGTGKSYVTISSGGSSGNYVTYAEYPGETAIIDGDDQAFNTSTPWTGPWLIRVTATYVKIEGLTLRDCSTDCILVSGGGDNVWIKDNEIYHGYYNGIQVNDGALDGIAEGNTVYDFYDTVQNGESANCIILNGTTIGSITGWVIRNNVVHDCSDDGIDTWMATGTIVNGNVSYDNGLGSDGDGFGFKLGSGGGGTIYNNAAYSNRGPGFGNNEGANTLINNTSVENNYGFENYTNAGTYTNNLCKDNTSACINFTEPPNNTETTNSWDVACTPTFVSTSPASADFLKLTSASDCINDGTTQGSPYNVDKFGTTRSSPPDLGWHEYTATSTGGGHRGGSKGLGLF